MLKQNRTKEPGGELRNQFGATLKELAETEDRKSTRLNSSHEQ